MIEISLSILFISMSVLCLSASLALFLNKETEDSSLDRDSL